jgi:alpha-1,3-rhamnosyl/mannosyltransferase
VSGATELAAESAARRPVRIGLDVGKALGALDGIGRYTRGLLAGLRELEAELSGATRFEYVLYPLFRCERTLEVAELIGDQEGFTVARRAVPAPGEVDLFHATAWAVPATYRGPLALTLYDLTFLTLAEAHTEQNRAHCLIGLSRALARGAGLCAISRSVRDEAARRLGLAPERIEVAAPAVDRRFSPAARDAVERARERLGIDRAYVLAVGTFEPRKNLRGLLEAWARLPAAVREGHRLVLAGGAGWATSAGIEPLARLAERLGISAEVLELGRVSDDLLPALYSGAALFAYPSLGEGFGLPPLEAMACGTPVVASDRPALPEALGDAAVLVDAEAPDLLAGAMASVLSDPERARAMRDAGLRRAAGYSWRSTAEAVRRLWSRVLGEPRGATA